MIRADFTASILVLNQPIDFRCGMDSLAALVQQNLATNPFNGTLYVFRSKRADRIKILAWDGTGLTLYQKRLEKGRFKWPPITNGQVNLTINQLYILIDGLDYSIISNKKIKAPIYAC